MLDKYMAQLQEDLNIEGSLEGETPGTFIISLDGETPIIISPLPIGFSLFCEIIETPKEREDIFLENALRANLFGQGTEGGILGLSDEDSFLTLTKSVEANVDYKTFKEILEDFLNSVEFWKEEVIIHNQDPDKQSPEKM
jgi:hypothetical protein